MLEIVNGVVIRLTRGNSAEIGLIPFAQTPKEPIILGEGDMVHFAVRDHRGRIVLSKLMTREDQTDGEVKLFIDPEDTLGMDEEESYLYDAVLLGADGSARTFIPCSPFVVLPAAATVKTAKTAEEEME